MKYQGEEVSIILIKSYSPNESVNALLGIEKEIIDIVPAMNNHMIVIVREEKKPVKKVKKG